MSCTMFSCKLLQIGHTDFQGIWPIYMQRWNRSRSGPETVRFHITAALSWCRWHQYPGVPWWLLGWWSLGSANPDRVGLYHGHWSRLRVALHLTDARMSASAVWVPAWGWIWLVSVIKVVDSGFSIFLFTSSLFTSSLCTSSLVSVEPHSVGGCVCHGLGPSTWPRLSLKPSLLQGCHNSWAFPATPLAFV